MTDCSNPLRAMLLRVCIWCLAIPIAFNLYYLEVCMVICEDENTPHGRILDKSVFWSWILVIYVPCQSLLDYACPRSIMGQQWVVIVIMIMEPGYFSSFSNE